MLEVTEGELADGGVDGLTRAQTGVVRLGDSSPAAVDAVDGQYVVGIAHGFEIDQ